MFVLVGVCRSLQRDGGPLPADQHRKDHRPGSPGEDEPSADDAAVLRRAVVSDTRRVRSEVCSARPCLIVSLEQFRKILVVKMGEKNINKVLNYTTVLSRKIKTIGNYSEIRDPQNDALL